MTSASLFYFFTLFLALPLVAYTAKHCYFDSAWECHDKCGTLYPQSSLRFLQDTTKEAQDEFFEIFYRTLWTKEKLELAFDAWALQQPKNVQFAYAKYKAEFKTWNMLASMKMFMVTMGPKNEETNGIIAVYRQILDVYTWQNVTRKESCDLVMDIVASTTPAVRQQLELEDDDGTGRSLCQTPLMGFPPDVEVLRRRKYFGTTPEAQLLSRISFQHCGETIKICNNGTHLLGCYSDGTPVKDSETLPLTEALAWL